MLLRDKLKYLRMLNKMTQQELANKLCVSKMTISNYEVGKTEPDIDMLVSIAEQFGVTVDYLVGHEIKSVTFDTSDLSENDERFFHEIASYILNMIRE